MSEKKTSIEYPPEQYPYRIKDWDKFQRYKFRNPPWIKLHVNTLQSEEWHAMDDRSKLLAVVLMLVASKTGGFLPKVVRTPQYLKRIGGFRRNPNLKPLIDCGFLIETHTDAHACVQNALQSTVTETEKKDILVHPPKAEAPPAYPPEFLTLWAAYPKREGANPKHLAYRAYVAALKKGADPLAIAEGASRLAASFTGKSKAERRYVPQAATWLNQRRWEDDTGPTLPKHQGFSV